MRLDLLCTGLGRLLRESRRTARLGTKVRHLSLGLVKISLTGGKLVLQLAQIFLCLLELRLALLECAFVGARVVSEGLDGALLVLNRRLERMDLLNGY